MVFDVVSGESRFFFKNEQLNISNLGLIISLEFFFEIFVLLAFMSSMFLAYPKLSQKKRFNIELIIKIFILFIIIVIKLHECNDCIE